MEIVDYTWVDMTDRKDNVVVFGKNFAISPKIILAIISILVIPAVAWVLAIHNTAKDNAATIKQLEAGQNEIRNEIKDNNATQTRLLERMTAIETKIDLLLGDKQLQ